MSATATKINSIRYAIEFSGDIVRNKNGSMIFLTENSAIDAINSLGLDPKYCRVVTRQTKLVNDRIYTDKKTQRTSGSPKRTSETRIEDACHTKQKMRGKRTEPTLFAVVGLDTDGKPKIVHVLCTDTGSAMEKASYKHDIMPISAVQGRLHSKISRFVTEAIIAAL